MRRFILICCLFYSVFAYSLTIPAGNLYFDNNKTNYTAVRFVYGSDNRKETYALAMTKDGNKWRVNISSQVNNMYRFTFVGGDIKTGLYKQDFNTFKDSISHQANLNRTATSDAQMQAGDIFVPQTNENWAQGSWMSLEEWESSFVPGTATISGTLPVVYITTENNAPISDKDTYIKGQFVLDSSAPLSMQIKGRGNWTWSGFDKKPYKIKFDVKQSILGMPNNKHWCLMAYADDYLGYLKNPTGHMISNALGMAWTPGIKPIELVLNGKYQGLYFLTEHVRIASNRVKITEQDDNATDSVSGGWLVEIDNYHEDGNVEFNEGNGQFVMVTIKEPEVLSSAQRTYIENQLYTLNDAIYGHSSSALWGMLDIDAAAKYYLIQEIMEDCESYHGSCYLYKDRDRNGKKEKWYFGPVWDFGNSFDRHAERWIYDGPTWPQYWIGQIATWPEFQDKVKEFWYVFYHSKQNTVRSQISDFVSSITQAAKNDAAVWDGSQNYQNNSNITQKKNDFMSRFNWRINWLYNQWGEGKQPATWNVEVESEESRVESQKILHNGQVLIIRNGKIYDLHGRLMDNR